jgi:uncharacterized protein YbbC (DUF1343 family)
MTTLLHFGIDHLISQRLPDLAGLRVGLITNDAATTAALPKPVTPVRLALREAGVSLVKLFSPEHGLGANAVDGAEVYHGADAATGLPVYSLYGATHRPTREMLADVDLLLFDIPDIGVRFYTYIWTLSHVMEACAETGLPLWVLDRPNPLGGELAAAEGPLLDETQVSSFVGRWSMPVRHSLSVGELARLWNSERKLDVALQVIAVQGWSRVQMWPDTGLPFVPTSPAMPSFETVLLYPGVCLFEGTNLSEGRGTTTPFRVAGAPWLDAYAVTEAFNAIGLAGVRARAVQFTPQASKFAGQPCQGVMLHVLEPAQLRPVAIGLHLLRMIIRQHPDEFAWLPYPTAAAGQGYGHFDRLIGILDMRQRLQQLDDGISFQISAQTAAGDWSARARPFLLYD